MWAWIMHLGKIWAVIRALFSIGTSFIEAYTRYKIARKNQELQEAADKLKAANEVTDDKQRIEQKIDALDELERLDRDEPTK